METEINDTVNCNSEQPGARAYVNSLVPPVALPQVLYQTPRGQHDDTNQDRETCQAARRKHLQVFVMGLFQPKQPAACVVRGDRLGVCAKPASWPSPSCSW